MIVATVAIEISAVRNRCARAGRFGSLRRKCAAKRIPGASSANELMHRMYTSDFPRRRIASLAKLVDDAARHGDDPATRILHNAAQQLATIASAVRGQLFDDREPVRIAYLGGVFRSDIVRERFCDVVALHDGVRVGPPVYGPAAGALLEAFRAAGVSAALSHVPEEKR